MNNLRKMIKDSARIEPTDSMLIGDENMQLKRMSQVNHDFIKEARKKDISVGVNVDNKVSNISMVLTSPYESGISSFDLKQIQVNCSQVLKTWSKCENKPLYQIIIKQKQQVYTLKEQMSQVTNTYEMVADTQNRLT